MKAESLEALIIDRALGELGPETAELLDAWMLEHGRDAELARELSELAAELKRATRQELGLLQPRSLRSARGGLSYFSIRWRVFAASAACLGIGIWLGSLWNSGDELPGDVPMEPDFSSVEAARGLEVGAAPTISADAFWSAERWRSRGGRSASEGIGALRADGNQDFRSGGKD